ncbi:flotillin [Aquimarina sp. EL_43]|uniref:flotillin family protein n=1 Tax=Aquimarina TaxID=290174 RepID=UPI00047157BD|nr:MULTISPECIES: flotillin family protein [Aquimarina]MBG6133610.1 flotillin [Aquimarina sp. EL_35]MBG6153828.1 flotillin [Aquimarina sp. EL_32]MBG6171938.1 flotillin [Aquimarina sp. EL_43]
MNIFSLFAGTGVTGIYLVAAVILIFVVFMFSMFRRYKRCPSDKVLVVYGKTGGESSSKCIHGGAAFIWPIIQDYSFLDLTPISIEVNLINALSKQNIRVNVPSRFTIGISTEPTIMQNAAERLLGLSLDAVQELAQEIIFGQLRLVVASMDIEEINTDRDKFLSHITHSVEAELKKVGLKLINVNITDIHDESGYIEALGKEAAAKAINDAIISVAQKDRDGAIGQAEALQDQRVQVAAANAKAVEGENTAKIQVANSDADRRAREAEAERIANASEKVQSAKALEEAYAAEKIAEDARAKRKEAEQGADIIVPAQIDKKKIEIDAEAEAEQIRRIAKGEADAIFMKKEAEAKGMYEILTKQAEGLDRIVKAAGNDPKEAVLLLIADKLPELVKTQAEAIKNIKIDKITVWENGNGEDGKTSTSNFISGMYKAVPPLQEMFNMAGMQLPNYLKGEEKENLDSEIKKDPHSKDKE